MEHELDWRIRTFFNWWRTRADFIASLDLATKSHEANVLTWAALDALASHWAGSVGRQSPSNRRRFDEFLAWACPRQFQRVSLPDVWTRIDRGERPNLGDDVALYLKTIGGREAPNALTARRMRMISEDPDLDVLVREALQRYPALDAVVLSEWLVGSRFGSIAYKRLRNAYLHEGRPGKDTHSFTLHDSDDGATYLSGVFSTPAILGFKSTFMLKVLWNSIDAFEREALANGVDPAA